MKKFWILAIALTFLSVPVFAAPPSGGHGPSHGGGMRGPVHGGVHSSHGGMRAPAHAGRPAVAHRPSPGHVGRPPMPPRRAYRRPHPLIITGGFYRPYYRPYYYYSTYYSPAYYYPEYVDPYYYDGINTTANVINAAAAAATAVRLWTW